MSRTLILRCFINWCVAFSIEMTLKYLQMKVAEQSSSQCLAVMVWAQQSVWNGRHSLTQLLHLVRTLYIFFLQCLFTFSSFR